MRVNQQNKADERICYFPLYTFAWLPVIAYHALNPRPAIKLTDISKDTELLVSNCIADCRAFLYGKRKVDALTKDDKALHEDERM